jgi:hypothetical protein
MAAYTIEQSLVGMVDFNVPEATLKAILFNNEVQEGTPVTGVDERERDLCLADLLMWLSSSSTATSGEYISDGGWQHQKANKVVVDRASLVARAKALYAKWDSEKAESVIGGKITIKSIY